MIDFFFGKPRTGKSYRAVKLIYDEYIVCKNPPKYKNILTNIGGFKFDDINEHFELDYEDKISQYEDDDAKKKKVKRLKANKLVWQDFYEKLVELHDMAVNKNLDDEALNKYADENDINDSLILLDEASFYLKKYDDAVSWYFAYHGHFRVRIIIITQSPKQIYREYMEHTELYYEAQPQSKQLKSNKFRYIIYDDYNFSKYSKYGSDSITAKKEVFDLYKSGEVDKPKKMLYKFFFLMALALVIMYGFWSLLMHRLSPDNIQDNNNTSQTDTVNYVPKENINSYLSSNDIDNNHFLLSLRCDDRFCRLLNNYKYEKNTITMDYFKYLIVHFQLTMFYSSANNQIYAEKKTNDTYYKKILAQLVDYTYKVPKSFKDTYLKSLFIVKQDDEKKRFSMSKSIPNNFTIGSNTSE